MLNLNISSLNGFFDGLWSPLKDFVEYVASWFGLLLFSIWTSVAQVLDCIQVIFQMLVGVQPVVYQSNSLFKNSGNLIMDIIMHPFVYNAFLRILVISFFLLLIFTFIAVIKNEYSSETTKGQGNSKGAIIGKSLKALFSFFFIPIVCMFGIIASSYLLQALDYATAPTESTVISNQLFYASAYSCNRARIDDNFYRAMMGEDVGGYIISENNATIFPGGNYRDQNAFADAIDKAFIAQTQISKFGNGTITNMTMGDRFDNYIDKCWIMEDDSITKDTYFNTKNGRMVYYFYDLEQFNWIIALFSIFFLGGILTSITLGAAVRLYELAILFIISPAIMALMPLDDGNAFKSWKKKFVGKVVMVFAPVVALNLYFILINTLLQIDISATLLKAIDSGLNMVSIGSMGLSLHGYLVQQVFSLFICIAGAMVVKESIKWLSEMIGGEDLMGAGDKLKKGVKDFVTTNAALAGGAAATKFIAGKAGGKMKEGITKKMGQRDTNSELQGEQVAAHVMQDEQTAAVNETASATKASEGRLEEQMAGLDKKSLNTDYTANAARGLGIDAKDAQEMKGQFTTEYQNALAETGDSKKAYEAANAAVSAKMTSMGINGDAQKAMQDAFKTDNQIRIMKMSKEERAAKMKEIRKNRQAKVEAEHAARRKNIQSGNREALQADTALQQRMIEAQNAVAENEFTAGLNNNVIAEAVRKGRRAQARHKVRTFAVEAAGAGIKGAFSGRETGRKNAEAEHNKDN